MPFYLFRALCIRPAMVPPLKYRTTMEILAPVEKTMEVVIECNKSNDIDQDVLMKLFQSQLVGHFVLYGDVRCVREVDAEYASEHGWAVY